MGAWSRKLAALATVDCTDGLYPHLVARSDAVLDVMRLHGGQAPILESCARFLSALMSHDPGRRSWRQCWMLLLKLCSESLVRDSGSTWGLRRALIRIVLDLRQRHEDLRFDNSGMTALSSLHNTAKADGVDVPGLDEVFQKEVEPWLASQVRSLPTITMRAHGWIPGLRAHCIVPSSLVVPELPCRLCALGPLTP